MTKRTINSDTLIHRGFEIGIFFKGLDGALEIILGAALYFVHKDTLIDIATKLTFHELREDPNDLIANHLINLAQHFSVSTQTFAVIYLLSHGVLKIFLVFSLWKQRLWAYPSAIVIFVIFAIYQLYRYSLNYSTGLLILTILDVFIVFLTWSEYKHLRILNNGR